MKKIFEFVVILLVITAFFVGGLWFYQWFGERREQKTLKEQIVGGDRDEYGCIPSAGYSWCPSTGQCQRMWEEYCEEYREMYRRDTVETFADCLAMGNPVMESYPRQCRHGDRTFSEDIGNDDALEIPIFFE